MLYIVMRYPVLMEDEGHHNLVMVCKTEKEAENCVADFVSDGYFTRDDLYVLQKQED